MYTYTCVYIYIYIYVYIHIYNMYIWHIHIFTHQQYLQHLVFATLDSDTHQWVVSHVYLVVYGRVLCRNTNVYTKQNLQTALVCLTTHCNTLQHTATHCNTLQHTLIHMFIRHQHIYMYIYINSYIYIYILHTYMHKMSTYMCVYICIYSTHAQTSRKLQRKHIYVLIHTNKNLQVHICA